MEASIGGIAKVSAAHPKWAETWYGSGMPIPTETALRGRARALIEAMQERERWIYAVPRDAGIEGARAILDAEGLRCEQEDAAAGVVRLSNEARSIGFVVFDSAELEVMLIEASGGDAAVILAKVLDKTGFYAQTQLLRTALDVKSPEASKALRTLAHMVVAWDEDWSDLFLLHLASPDPVVRHEAALATGIAAMVARDPGPTIALLEEAIRRESFPKLRDTLGETLNLVRAMTGGPVEMKPETPPIA
jgi:hypothetical protein